MARFYPRMIALISSSSRRLNVCIFTSSTSHVGSSIQISAPLPPYCCTILDLGRVGCRILSEISVGLKSSLVRGLIFLSSTRTGKTSGSTNTVSVHIIETAIISVLHKFPFRSRTPPKGKILASPNSWRNRSRQSTCLWTSLASFPSEHCEECACEGLR